MKDVRQVSALFDNITLAGAVDFLGVCILAYLWYRIESIQAGVDFITNTIEDEQEKENS